MSDNIPFDIQTEIIRRVPDVKSLLQFRAVSRPWKSFIDSSEFIDGYGAHDTRPHSLLLRYRNTQNHPDVKYLCFIDDGNFTQPQQDFAPTIPLLIKKLNSSFVVGYSHGLLCLLSNSRNAISKERLVLWNPSIRKSVAINPPSYVVHACDVFGFAVCPVTNDPTIVKIKCRPWRVEMFTLNSKRWAQIRCRNVLPKLNRLEWPQVVIDRCIYWISYDYFDRLDHMIVSFDLVVKEFKFVDVPKNLANPFPFRFFISKLRESLVLFVPNKGAEIPACGVWKMEDDGSFTKLFTFNTPDSSIRKVFGFRKNDEPVMETKKEGEHTSALEVYEPCSERIKNLGICGNQSTIFMASYKETLLLLDHPDCCVYPNRKRSRR